jgi:hypothetical protein
LAEHTLLKALEPVVPESPKSHSMAAPMPPASGRFALRQFVTFASPTSRPAGSVPKTRGRKSPLMTDQEFDRLLSDVVEQLKRKQDALTADHGLGSHAKWWLDQETGSLQFMSADGTPQLVAQVINIGSYSSQSSSWKWAWANQSLPDTIREKSIRLKQLEDVTGISLFANDEAIGMDEAMAWELAAFSVWHLGAMGCYRAPSSNGLQVFLAITSVERCVH